MRQHQDYLHSHWDSAVTLVFRPSHHSPQEDYDIVCGALVIGTIVKERVARSEKWRWYVHGITAPPIGNVRLSGYEPDLDGAKSAVLDNWENWLKMTKLKETD
jgi:hypothetical protein